MSRSNKECFVPRDAILKEALEALSKNDLPAVADRLACYWASAPRSHGYEQLAASCLMAGRYDLAEAHAEAFLAAQPAADSTRRLAAAFAEGGLLEVAERLLAIAAPASREAEAWNDLGVVQWGLRRRGDAISSLEQAVALDPAHAEASDNLSFVKTAQEPVRLLVLSDARSPHTQRYVHYFANAGYAVHLLCDTWVDIPGVTVHVPETPIPVLNLQAWVAVCQQLIRDLRPDLVHGHYASIYGLWGALTGFHPYVLTLWGSDINVDPYLSPNYQTLVQFALEQADILIGQSHDLNDKAEALATGSLAVPHRLTFGIDTEKFSPGLDTQPLRERLELGNGPVILSPRQFKSAANIHRIIEAVPAVRERYGDVIFVLNTVITAEDEYYLKLMSMIDELGIGSCVRILADVPYDEMPFLYNLAAATLSVRDADGASNTVMESLACLTPVIASDIPTNHELMGAHSGTFVDPHEPGAIARAILAILDDPDQAARMGRQGRERICDAHDHSSNMARMRDLFTPWIEHRMPCRSRAASWQARAWCLWGADHRSEAHSALAIASSYALTPWEHARVMLTSELLEPSGSDGKPIQGALAAILSSCT